MTTTIDYSTKDYEGFRADLIEMLKSKIPEYTDFSSSDAGIVLIELLSYGLDILSYYTDKVANELYMDTAQERESLLKLCKFINYTPNGATSSKVYQVVNVTPSSKDFVLNIGFQFSTDGQYATDKVLFEVETDTTIPAGKTGLEKDSSGKYLYPIPLVQGYSIGNDILGSSNGTAYQRFILNYKPVVHDSLQVFINEGSGFRLWDKVDNFIDSAESDRVYRVFEDSEGNMVVEFGSGASGKIPSIFQNGIMASYRVGGGSQGNVAANMITKVVSNVSGIIETFNPDVPYILGTDSESNDEIKINAPASLRTIGDRAVTLDDYRDLMMLRGDVLMCKPYAHDDRITIELITVLKGGLPITNDYKNEIIEYFDDRKEIGYNITVTQATPHPITLQVDVQAYPKYVNASIKNSVTNLCQQFFALGNSNFKIGDVFSDEDLRFSIKSLGGINKISITCSDVIGSNEYITLGNLTVNVTGGV